jgi:hypothetical protein
MPASEPLELAAAPARPLHQSVGELWRRRRDWVVVSGLALLVAASVARFKAPRFVVETGYTDHLRHEYAAWAFLHIGYRIFDTPLGEWHVHAAHPHTLFWPTLPEWYPPGLILLFLPFGVASNEGVIPDPRVHMLMVMVLGAAAVVASYAFIRALRLLYEPTLAIVIGVVGTIIFVDWSLNGFVDPLAAGLAIAGIYWSERDAPGRGLLALCAGLSIHFRLWYLWPVAISIAVTHWRAIRRWQLVTSGVLAASSVVALALAAPSAGKLGTIHVTDTNYLALKNGLNGERTIALVGAAVLLATVALSERRLTPLACVALALGLVFGVNQWEAWYPVLLMPLFLVVRTRWAQAALVFAFLQLVVILNGLPNEMRWLHLYYLAVAH